MKPIFFETAASFRRWFEENHEKETELLVGFYKRGSGRPSITWPESVDVALCFGWIDAVRKSIDDESYSIRFTRRKTTSIWSIINIKKAEELMSKGLMCPAGLEAYKHRKENKSGIYNYENEAKELVPAYLKTFKSNKKAWDYFQSQPAGYKKQMIYRIMSARREETQLKRLAGLIAKSENGERITN